MNTARGRLDFSEDLDGLDVILVRPHGSDVGLHREPIKADLVLCGNESTPSARRGAPDQVPRNRQALPCGVLPRSSSIDRMRDKSTPRSPQKERGRKGFILFGGPPLLTSHKAESGQDRGDVGWKTGESRRLRVTSPIRSPLPIRAPVHSPDRSPAPGRLRSPIRKREKRQVLQRVSSEAQADASIERIKKLKAGLFHRIASASGVLSTAQDVINECGRAIANWFGSLSGPALEAAIKNAFTKFDADESGLIDRGEFARAMYALGLRLNDDQYDILFQKCDVDNSGQINLQEFTHMIKAYLGKACVEECHTCEMTEGSNQPDKVYRPR